MEPNLFRYIWQKSRAEQIVVLLIILVSIPFNWASFDVPKRIVNDAIQGNAFRDGRTTATLMDISVSLPSWLGGGTHQLFEDPNVPGRYLAIDTPEFATHASGQLLRIVAPPSLNPDLVEVEYLTPRSTYETAGGADDSGRYRNPIVLANGAILAAHTPDTGEDAELGSATPGDPIIVQYDAAYDFRLRFLVDPENDGTFVPGAPLIAVRARGACAMRRHADRERGTRRRDAIPSRLDAIEPRWNDTAAPRWVPRSGGRRPPPRNATA